MYNFSDVFLEKIVHVDIWKKKYCSCNLTCYLKWFEIDYFFIDMLEIYLMNLFIHVQLVDINHIDNDHFSNKIFTQTFVSLLILFVDKKLMIQLVPFGKSTTVLSV